jgi:hypothetical protein
MEYEEVRGREKCPKIMDSGKKDGTESGHIRDLGRVACAVDRTNTFSHTFPFYAFLDAVSTHVTRTYHQQLDLREYGYLGHVRRGDQRHGVFL